MGYSGVSMDIPGWLRLEFLRDMVSLFKLLVVATITRLGLLKPPGQPLVEDPITTKYVLLTAMIKMELPVITYKMFLDKMGEDYQVKHHHKSCIVCFEELRAIDEIRELCNCCHVFHSKCLDDWMDQGQIRCPLCRSLLFV